MSKSERIRHRPALTIASLTLGLANCEGVADPETSVAEVTSSSVSEGESVGGAGLEPRADASDELGSCTWESFQETGTEFVNYCAPSQRPIAGLCLALEPDATITDSHPFENDDASNLPEDGDSWYGTAVSAGWRCAYDVSVDAAVSVLCCGTA